MHASSSCCSRQAAASVCDSPKPLIESTLDWLADNWMASPSDTDSDGAGKGIDFIIWTGDTARHDIDFTHPRNAPEIFDYNRWALALVEQRFPGVPIVPNLGNNDIIPHNIMFPGPNSMTNAYEAVWKNHIPEDELLTFQDGGYFSKQVIADDLAVLSLNTLYWYDANAATRGCKGRNDPGTIELDWMESTLDTYRNRSMQVQLIGHVPPTAGNYFPNCYERYTDMALRYQDTIVGQHFGHMNIDAWFLQEEAELRVHVGSEGYDVEDGGDLHATSLSSDLRKDFDVVPTKQKTNPDAYLAFFVSPSVVPTYLPTVRVWTYNASRPLQATKPAVQQRQPLGRHQNRDFAKEALTASDEEPNDPILLLNNSINLISRDISAVQASRRSHRRPKHGGKRHRKHRNLPRFTSPDSPSRKNGYLTMLGYSQWILDLDDHNRRHRKTGHNTLDYQLEYSTYEAATLWSEYLDTESADGVHTPVPKHLLERELARRKARSPSLSVWSWPWTQQEAGTAGKRKVKVPRKIRHLTNYALPSFTIDHLLEWARELAGNEGMWKSFVRRIYTETGSEE